MLLSRQRPQDELQDAAVPDVVDLVRRVEAEGDRELLPAPLLVGRGDLELLPGDEPFGDPPRT